MAERVTDEDLELLGELGLDTAPAESSGRTAREQRIIAGFEEIERFVAEHGHPPQHGENRDIFERLYAVRLDAMRESAECREVLKNLDTRGLLVGGEQVGASAADEASTDEDLLASLGVEASPAADDVTRLVHVRSQADRKAAEEVAQRTPCADFETFRPVFDQVQQELAAGARRTVPFKYRDNQAIEVGDWFVLDGQKAFVAGAGEPFVAEYGERDRRLRVVFDNGTESDLLMRSLRRALNKDQQSRRILPSDAEAAPLFSDQPAEDDAQSGTIYVARSLSDHPFIKEHRELVHKIGVTGGDVNHRVGDAKKGPTYLLADVEIVATYKLANINRTALEALLHKFFGKARLDLALKDRFGLHVEPKEWFLVPLAVVDEAIQKIKEGTIGASGMTRKRHVSLELDTTGSEVRRVALGSSGLSTYVT